MAEKTRILFLCTGNSCRSQMAEAILRHLGGDRFDAQSAGSHPAGFIHPLAVTAMDRLNIPIAGARSKSWDAFADVPFDAVITLCDEAAKETCPTFPGAPISVHWGLPDPVYHPGTHDERIAFALRLAEQLKSRIEALVNLDWNAEQSTLRRELERLSEA